MSRFITIMSQILIFWGVSANAVSNNCYVKSPSGKKPAVRCVLLNSEYIVTMCDGSICRTSQPSVKMAKFTCPRSKKEQKIEAVLDGDSIAFFQNANQVFDLKSEQSKDGLRRFDYEKESYAVDPSKMLIYKESSPQETFQILAKKSLTLCE